jgi:hypothetical protein
MAGEAQLIGLFLLFAGVVHFAVIVLSEASSTRDLSRRFRIFRGTPEPYARGAR